ncbi:hypothetical protein C1646_678249 [Rhizophagus diaphanus]|nr:hypothetical protein C1646_678249 [Rhizophagus diaphanus] [Rhizophagus sp. MUCL 43196]
MRKKKVVIKFHDRKVNLIKKTQEVAEILLKSLKVIIIKEFQVKISKEKLEKIKDQLKRKEEIKIKFHDEKEKIIAKWKVEYNIEVYEIRESEEKETEVIKENNSSEKNKTDNSEESEKEEESNNDTESNGNRKRKVANDLERDQERKRIRVEERSKAFRELLKDLSIPVRGE